MHSDAWNLHSSRNLFSIFLVFALSGIFASISGIFCGIFFSDVFGSFFQMLCYTNNISKCTVDSLCTMLKNLHNYIVHIYHVASTKEYNENETILASE